MMRTLVTVGGGAALACSVLVLPSAADDYCVACRGPAATYHCIVDTLGPADPQATRLACISQLARSGGHEACSLKVDRAQVCSGTVRHIDLAGPPTDATPPQRAPEQAAAPAEPANAEPPATVEEAMRRAAKSTGDGVANAGKSIGDGAKKTWNCVASLFKSC